ncbi:MAG: HAMP domain-containing histidine kinase [Desulfobacula sp.]|nr:HAMP domain-containing histidine kinase [Desulfobacula sp.]
MNDAMNFINMEGLKFFGKVNASISHELKNILAIISETAGFLNDLTDLAKQGQELKLSLLEGCSESIAEDIQRGFTTIKQMNRFAHSVDTPIKEIDLFDTLELTVNLSEFLSFASKVQISKNDKETQSILTCPFLLQNLIYQILIFTYKATGPDGDIQVRLTSEKEEGTSLIFSNPGQLALEGFPTQKIQKTADALGVELTINSSCNELDIWIPYASNKITLLAKELQIDSYTANSEGDSTTNR